MQLQHSLDPEDRYIRRVIQIPHTQLIDSEDEPSDFNLGNDNMLKIIICMYPEASRRLSEAQYLQSDIGFKRVTGFYEFEIGNMNRITNTSKSRSFLKTKYLFNDIAVLYRYNILSCFSQSTNGICPSKGIRRDR